jgi:hypothetical protein
LEWTIIRVARRGATWRVEVDGEEQGREFREEGVAEAWARDVARARRPGQVLVTGPRGALVARGVYAAPQETLR